MTILKQKEFKEYLPPQADVEIQSTNKPAAQFHRVDIRQTESGLWEVRGPFNQRGGLFRDYKSAARFIKHEFQSQNSTLVVLKGGQDIITSQAA